MGEKEEPEPQRADPGVSEMRLQPGYTAGRDLYISQRHFPGPLFTELMRLHGLLTEIAGSPDEDPAVYHVEAAGNAVANHNGMEAFFHLARVGERVYKIAELMQLWVVVEVIELSIGEVPGKDR
jgi:hypothetical protein